jgi:hypothetical protein
MTSEDIQKVIEANVDRTVEVTDEDGMMQTLLVHTVDEEGFTCDVVSEIVSVPRAAYWIRFRHLRDVRPLENTAD